MESQVSMAAPRDPDPGFAGGTLLEVG